MYRFHRRLASFARVIRLDQRGIGMSSRVPSLDVIGPKFWAKDAISVMDAIGCERATILAPYFASMTGLVLAADYPERVSSLVIINGAARTLRADDYPIGFEIVETDPLRDGRDGAGCRRPGRRHPGCHRAQRRRRRRIPTLVGHGRQPRRLTQHGPRRHPDRAPVRCPRHPGAYHRADADHASRQPGFHARSPTAGTSPSTSPDHASSNCRAQMRSTGSATPRRCSTRSRSSSPACGAVSVPSGC